MNHTEINNQLITIYDMLYLSILWLVFDIEGVEVGNWQFIKKGMPVNKLLWLQIFFENNALLISKNISSITYDVNYYLQVESKITENLILIFTLSEYSPN